MDRTQTERIKKELRGLRRREGGHSVNFYLLVAVVILLISLIGASVYFLTIYKGLEKERKSIRSVKAEVEDRLTKCEVDLEAEIKKREMMMEELNITSSTRESLNKLYVNLSNEKERIAADLNNTKETLEVCKIDLQETNDQLQDAINEVNEYIDKYNQKVLELQEVRDQLSSLNSELNDCEEMKDDLASKLSYLKSCISEHNCSACED